MSGKEVVLRTPTGRYEWWEALQVVDFVLKGQRIPVQSWCLDGRTGIDRAAAIAKAERVEAQRRRNASRV